MRVSSQYIALAVSSILTLSGCVSSEVEPVVNGINTAPDFSATIGDDKTRAFDQSWEQGDEIGITGCGRSNVCYFTNSGGNFRVKKNGEQIYFQNDAETEFIAYYPWKDMEAVAVISADTRNQSQQKSFDFLWARASGKKEAPNVSFNFAHRMAKLVVTVMPGEDMSYEELKATRLALKGFRPIGSFNPEDGTTTAKGNLSDAWAFTEFAQFNETGKYETFSFIFFPQVFGQPLEFLAMLDKPDNNSLSLKAELDFTDANREKDGNDAKNQWVAGRQYNLTLTLNKTDVKFSQCNINPWTEVAGEEIVVD